MVHQVKKNGRFRLCGPIFSCDFEKEIKINNPVFLSWFFSFFISYKKINKMSSPELPPLTKKDTLVHFNKGHAEEGNELTRVVLVCLDPESADITFQWALDNFISPSKDLVSFHIIFISIITQIIV